MESRTDPPPQNEGAEAPERPDQPEANPRPWFKPAVAYGMAGVIGAVHGLAPHTVPDAIPTKMERIEQPGWLGQGGRGDPNAPREHLEITANTSTGPMIAAAWGHPLEPHSARYLNSFVEPKGTTDPSSGQNLTPRIFVLS